MAQAPASATFHLDEYENAWLEDVEASPEMITAVYGCQEDKCDDVLICGQWCPRFPTVRPLLNVHSVVGRHGRDP